MKKILIAIVISFCGLIVVRPAHAAITFDASSTKQRAAQTTATSSISIGTGNNELLAICIGITANAGTVSNVTVNGSAATFIASSSGGTRPSFLYYFLGGNTTAGTDNVSTTFAASYTSMIGLSSFFGVSQSTPIDASTTVIKTVTNPSSTITTSHANDVVIDCLSSGNATGTTLTANSGQIVTSINTSTLPLSGASYKVVPTAQSTSTGWTFSGSAFATDYINAALIAAGTVQPQSTDAIFFAGD